MASSTLATASRMNQWSDGRRSGLFDESQWAYMYRGQEVQRRSPHRGGIGNRSVESSSSRLIRDFATLSNHRSKHAGSTISPCGSQSQRYDSWGSNDANTIVKNPTRNTTVFSSQRLVPSHERRSEATPDDFIRRSNTRIETPLHDRPHQNRIQK